jgi:hypothetical protein
MILYIVSGGLIETQGELIETLKKSNFKGDVSNDKMGKIQK